MIDSYVMEAACIMMIIFLFNEGGFFVLYNEHSSYSSSLDAWHIVGTQ